MNIDYKLLGDASTYYSTLGFTRIEVPWMVTEEIDNITKPFNIESQVVTIKNKSLVASAEQSFLYQYLKGYLPKGKFHAITPCFRNEPYGITHSKVFMKLELIDTLTVTEDNLIKITDLAYGFFYSSLPDKYHKYLVTVETEEGFDIELNGVELGSYGIRSCEYLKWIYATGLAEPRFSKALSKLEWDITQKK